MDFFSLLIILLIVSSLFSKNRMKRFQKMKEEILSIPGQLSGNSQEQQRAKTSSSARQGKITKILDQMQMLEQHAEPSTSAYGEGESAQVVTREGTTDNDLIQTRSSYIPMRRESEERMENRLRTQPFSLPDADGLIQAIVMSEILGKPKAMRRGRR